MTLANVKNVSEDRRGEVSVEDVMTGLEDAQVVRLDTTLTEALDRFREGAQRLLVLDAQNEVRGMLTQNELLRRMHVRQALES